MIERLTMGQLTRGTITDWSLSESSRISTSCGSPDQWGWQTGQDGPLLGSERGFQVGGASKALKNKSPRAVCNCGWESNHDCTMPSGIAGSRGGCGHCPWLGCCGCAFAFSLMASVGDTTRAAGFKTGGRCCQSFLTQAASRTARWPRTPRAGDWLHPRERRRRPASP